MPERRSDSEVYWTWQWRMMEWRKRKMKYVCDVCGWIYDEEVGDAELGIAPGTAFDELPEDFLCPVCFVGKESFHEE